MCRTIKIFILFQLFAEFALAGKPASQIANATPTPTPAPLPYITQTGENTGDQFGKGVGFAGDFNGDLKEDYIIGAWSANADNGKVYIYSGDTNQLITSINGEAGAGRFGRSVDSAGDFNGDGVGDVVVSAPVWGSQRGKVYVYGGNTGTLLFSATGTGNDNLGDRVAGRFDFNHDGYGDIVAGSPYADGNGSSSGAITIFGGPNGQLLFSQNGPSANAQLGTAVASAGDVNGDGYDDVIAGTFQAGVAYVYAGGLTPSTLCTLTGEGTGNFGIQVSGAGDVDNDGYDDVIVAATGYNNIGKVYVYAGPDCSRLIFSKLGENGKFGHTVSPAGDYNRDGFDDVLVTARDYKIGAKIYGKVYILAGPHGDLLYSYVGPAASSNFGASAAGGFDLNLDGIPDFIVGAFDYLSGRGRAYIFSP